MPRAYDRNVQAVTDKDPTRFGTDYQDPMGAIGETAKDLGTQIRDNLAQAFKDLTGIDLTGPLAFLDWIGEQINNGLGLLGELWNQLLGGVINILNFVGDAIATTVGNFIDTVQNIFYRGDNAALSADHANISVQALKASLAGGGTDEFDYAEAASLPTANFAISEALGGAGTYGPNGNGFVVWKPSGSGAREVVYRRKNTVLGSDNGVVTVVWAKRMLSPFPDQTFGYICGRMNNSKSGSSNDTYLRARIGYNGAAIEWVNNGTAYPIGPAVVGISTRDGDVFDFYFGTTSNPRRFWLKQNGVVILDRTESGTTSLVDSNHRSVGFGAVVGQYLYPFRLGQNPAPALAGMTWAVQTLSAP